MKPDLRARFVDFVLRRRLIAHGDRVLVAFSGGTDSVVLLHLLRESTTALGIELAAAHFDHAMRPDSVDDAAWVAGLCQAWDVPLLAARSSAALYGEAAARTARYDFLTQAARQWGATRVATAHHADDQIETVIFRLLRGSGVRGLAGIPLRRGAIIRPLLRFHKAELQLYANRHQLSFREDETNQNDAYARNRIRRAVIPVLQTVHNNAPAAILALARNAARSERAWKSLLEQIATRLVIRRERDVTELARGILLEYDAEIRARLLRTQLHRFGCVPDRAATRALLRFAASGGSGTSVDVGAGVRIERAYDVLRITRAAPKGSGTTVHITSCKNGRALARIGENNWNVQWKTSPAAEAEVAQFACDALDFPLEVRGWCAGDRIRMAYGTKKLKKLFAEARVPFDQRASVPVIADANGKVYWVVGVARSVDAIPAPNESALTITVSHAEIS